MSVGNAGLTGLQRQATPPPKQAVQTTQGSQAANQGPRAAAFAQATNPTLAPAPAVATPGAPVAPAVGGTTAPAGRTAAAPATQAQAPNFAATLAAATMANPAVLTALAGIAITTNRSRVSSISGDAKEDMGDVGLTTEAEDQPDALQEAGQEQGAGEITEAGSASGPAT